MFDVNDKLTSSQNTEENALDVFRRAVNNGQTRLALEALVDVIDSIVDVLTDSGEEPVTQEPIKNELKTSINSLEIKEEKTVEVSSVPKKKTKETTVDITE